jgi:plasmid stability protein
MYPVTLNLPVVLYERLKRRAQQADRSVEAELLDVLATAIPSDDELPSYLAEALASLALLDDETLWKTARSHLPAEEAAQLEQLNLKQQREGLTSTEAETLEQLARQYERTMLVRAQAVVLLIQRGYNTSKLIAGKQ